MKNSGGKTGFISSQLSARRRSYLKGLMAERYTGWILRFKGYKILESRYKTPVGEIDLIARRKNTIIFIEVKSRALLRDGLEAVTSRSRGRITRAAQYYLAENHPEGDRQDCRFDVIICSNLSLTHLKNAW